MYNSTCIRLPMWVVVTLMQLVCAISLFNGYTISAHYEPRNARNADSQGQLHRIVFSSSISAQTFLLICFPLTIIKETNPISTTFLTTSADSIVFLYVTLCTRTAVPCRVVYYATQCSRGDLSDLAQRAYNCFIL